MLSPIIKGLTVGLSVLVVSLMALVSGVSIEGFLALIAALNAFEMAVMVDNTASINRLKGRYDSEHD